MTAFTSLCDLGEEGKKTKGRNSDIIKTKQTLVGITGSTEFLLFPNVCTSV